MKIKVVAEIANSHSGRLDYLDRLILEVAEGGFRFVKFQIYTAAELIDPRHTRFNHFNSQAIDLGLWSSIVSKTQSVGLVPIADVYGIDSLKKSSELGFKHLKIPASNRILPTGFVDLLSRMELIDIYLSVTAWSFYEISRRIRFLRSILSPKTQITLIHGHQEFPTPLQNTNIDHIKKLRDKFGDSVNIGFADHTNPDEEGITDACLVAIGAGANYVEKHVSLEREITTVDFHSSIKPSQFKQFTDSLDRSNLLLSPNPKSEKAGIESYLKKMRKFPVANQELSPGRKLREGDFSYLRVEDSSGILPRTRGGEVVTRHIARGTSPKFEDCSHRVVAVVLCRSDSKRLPKKALLSIANTTPIIHLLNRVKRAKFVDQVVLATTDRLEDDELSKIVTSEGFMIYRGSNLDVLGRMINSAEPFQPHHIIRITGDDILLSVDDLDNAIKEHIMTESHYTNMLTIPSGTEAEIFEYEFLRDLYKARLVDWDTEYLTNCLNEISEDEFVTHNYVSSKNRNRAWRLTLDTDQDWNCIKAIFEALEREGIKESYDLDDLIRVVESDRQILEAVINSPNRNHLKPKTKSYLNWFPLEN